MRVTDFPKICNFTTFAANKNLNKPPSFLQLLIFQRLNVIPDRNFVFDFKPLKLNED